MSYMPRVRFPSFSLNLGELDTRNLRNDLNDQVNAAVESAVQDVFTQLSTYIASLFPGRRPVPAPTPTPVEPTTLSGLLESLINESVQVTTPFDTLTGTVIAVQNDYIALVGTDGEVFLVAIDKIEAVSEL